MLKANIGETFHQFDFQVIAKYVPFKEIWILYGQISVYYSQRFWARVCQKIQVILVFRAQLSQAKNNMATEERTKVLLNSTHNTHLVTPSDLPFFLVRLLPVHTYIVNDISMCGRKLPIPPDRPKHAFGGVCGKPLKIQVELS